MSVVLKELNESNEGRFNKLFNKSPVIIYYYMDGCFWCEKFSPIWNKFSKKKMKNLIVIKVESNNRHLLPFESNISGYPTINLYNNGKELGSFNDERTVENLVNFVNKKNILKNNRSVKKNKRLKKSTKKNKRSARKNNRYTKK